MKKYKWAVISISLIAFVAVIFLFFFVKTATVAHPGAMQLMLPEDKNDTLSNSNSSNNTITIILYENDGIYSFTGDDIKSGSKFSYTGTNSIKDFLLQKKNQIPEDGMTVIIKSGPLATDENTVDILDEMSTNSIKRYALTEITADEEKFIKSLEK